jgi:hypothetical protein
MDIHLYYRHVHSKSNVNSRDPNKVRPSWFSHENCFRNLIDTITYDAACNKVKLNIVYDGTTEDLQNDFVLNYISNPKININVFLIDAGSDLNSFVTTLQIAKTNECSEEDIIYLLENDYLHQYDWIEKAIKAFESKHKIDYVSLYDHYDKYIYEIYDSLLSKVYFIGQHHWRTSPSTCASFMCKKKTLMDDFQILTSGITDFYFFTKIVNEKNKNLITPIPGLSTHCMNGYTSPSVDWENISIKSN